MVAVTIVKHCGLRGQGELLTMEASSLVLRSEQGNGVHQTGRRASALILAPGGRRAWRPSGQHGGPSEQPGGSREVWPGTRELDPR